MRRAKSVSRLLDLQNETYRIVENKQTEQAARDAKQIRDVDARWKAAERQNGSRRVYSTLPVRRTSGFNQYSNHATTFESLTSC